jgi:2-polyprenyl-3-methyl-5-hydroxy-6-metoxy-1,4-benzoquinol methylase
MDEKSFRTKQASSSKDVLNFYDEYAESWDRRFGETESVTEFHASRLGIFLELAKLSIEKTAVELGVGTGPYVNRIAPLVKQLICVDGSGEMLKIVRKKVENLNNVSLKQMDLSKPCKKVDFKGDVVYFLGLIEHVIEIDVLIENCKLMLNDGGTVVVVSSNAFSPWYYGLRRIFRAGMHCSTDKYYSRSSLGKIMDKHGLSEECCKYFGFVPPGVEGVTFKILRRIGNFFGETPLKIFAGGMAIRYLYDQPKG